MSTYSLSHLNDETLLRDLAALVARDRVTTADLVAHIAEVDARKLYLPTGYPSMHAYCIERLGLSADAAYKRITVARAGRQFPAIFAAIARGRLHLTGAAQLAPHLRPGNAGDLIEAATGKTKSAIEELIAQRFPSSEMLPMVSGLSSKTDSQLAPKRVGEGVSDTGRPPSELVPERVPPRVHPSNLAPIATERFALQITISKSVHDRLCYAQTLLSHQIPNPDIAKVFERVLELAIARLEKRKFAATDRPRQNRGRPSTNPRTIPAYVQRAVWQRDGGRCAFVSSEGHRCSAREGLEFDHVEPVARGGQATVNGVRLLCRAHNQYAADCAFGADFMRRKRGEARRDKEERRVRQAGKDAARAPRTPSRPILAPASPG